MSSATSMPSGFRIGTIAGVGSIEILIRSFGTSSSSVSVDFIVTAVSLFGTEFVNSTLVAWSVGWIFLGTLAYQTFYRVDVLQGKADVSRRFAYLGGAVLATLVGAGLTWRILSLQVSYGTTPVAVTDRIVWLLVIVAVIVIVVSDDPIFDIQLAFVLGAGMMIAAMLYPLPEVAVIVWFLTGVGANTIPLGPSIKQLLNDPVERLLMGIAATTNGVRGFLMGLYIISGLMLSAAVFLDSPGTIEQNLRTLIVSLANSGIAGEYAVSSMREGAFLLLTAFAPAAYGIWYWLRIAERLPFALGLAADPTANSSSKFDRFGVREWGPNQTGGDHSEIEGMEHRPIPPGYGLPIVLLMLPLLVYVDGVANNSTAVIPPGYLMSGGFAALLAIVTIVLVRVKAASSSSDSKSATTVAPTALALQLAVISFIGPESVSLPIHHFLTGQPLGMDLFAVGSAFLGAIVLGGIVYLLSKISSVLEANDMLGLSLLIMVFGFLIGVLAGGNDLIQALGGSLIIIGIIGLVVGVVVDVGAFVSDI